MTSSTASLRFGGTDVGTSADIDFPNLSTGSATVRFFRSTNTAGAVSVIFYKGDNTSTAGHTFTSLGNYTMVGNFSQTGTGTFGTGTGVFTHNGAITIADAKDITVNTSTGTKFGTAVGQKMGFWNATPVIQQAGANQVAMAAYATGAFGLDSNAHMQAMYDLVAAMRTALVNTGIIKGAA